MVSRGIQEVIMVIGEMWSKPIKLVQNRIYRGYPGGREIEKFRGVEGVADDYAPEAWVGSTTYTYHHATDSSSILGLAEAYNEDGGVLFLKDVIESNPTAYLGETHVSKFGNDTGILVKLLDAQRQLGLQCHPDRPFAKEHFNSNYGKVECWYVIGLRDDQDEKPYLLLGFKEGITREKFEKLFLKGDIRTMENWCHKITPKIGEMYFVDAGVPHAIGPGCFVIEVQEPSDITVGATMRHFDNTIDKEKFIERTMGSYHYVGRNYEGNLKAYDVKPKTFVKTEGGTETLLLGSEQTSYFSVTRLDINQKLKGRDTGTFSMAIVISGKGIIEYDGDRIDIKKGDEIFLPAGVKDLEWKADDECLSVVVCYPPEVQ
jgi:mannose-6-phosphate isomerase